jgi:diadenosine tetraphosphatase ApaH/serine/threonine PP2A family protein phosphatase
VIALLYDVHGNLPALEAVLDDAEAAGAEHHLVGGDVAAFGAWPESVLMVLRERVPDAVWLRGNTERWLTEEGRLPDLPEDHLMHPAALACAEALGPEPVAALFRLQQRVELPGGGLAVHGSPVSDMRSFLPEPAPDEADLLLNGLWPLLVFGHLHLQFARTAVDGTTQLVAPGSVGVPLDGDPRAAYALLDPATGHADLRRVAYDHERSAAALRERYPGAAWADTVARRITTARP